MRAGVERQRAVHQHRVARSDRQAEADAGAELDAGAALRPALDDALALLRVEPGPGVGHRDPHPAGALLDRDLQRRRRAAAAVAQRVVDQVGEDAFEQRRRCHRDDRCVEALGFEVDAGGVGTTDERNDDVAHELVDAHRRQPDAVARLVGERQREQLVGATRIAVPGCNVTAITLGLAPGIAAGVIAADDLVSVLAVGTSGAGKSAKTELLASEIAGSASAYQVGGIHRHNPEIVQNLSAAGGVGVTISFTPVLVPMSRGILATSTAKLAPGATEVEIREAWESAYADEPFVHVLPAGRFPRSGDTTGANTALIGLAVDERAGRVVAVSAIDNLVKGTAGGALQSLNLALGLPETLGLPLDGVAP